MEQRVDRLEQDHRDLAEKYNTSQEDRQRDLGMLYVQIASVQSDMRLIKWFAGVAGAAVIVYLISLLAERVWM